MSDTKNMNLNELSVATRENLESLGYGTRTIQMLSYIWKDLLQFLAGRNEIPFQPIYGLEYLHERIGYPECLYRKLTPRDRDYNGIKEQSCEITPHPINKYDSMLG